VEKGNNMLDQNRTKQKVLEVMDLSTSFYTSSGIIRAVKNVNLSLYKNQCLALIGESGAGKSVTSLSIMRMVPSPGTICGGAIMMNGRNLLEMPGKEFRKLRGTQLSMMFQDPLASLNPVITVGAQIRETILAHRKTKKKEAEMFALEKLRALKLPAQRVYNSYPFQLSGGMRQRASLALALILHPQILIADEPTSSLDVTLQGQILAELNRQLSECCLSLLFITHDLAAAASIANRVAVMYGGMIVEEGPLREVFNNPCHPYTRALIKSHPSFCSSNRLEAITGSAPRTFENIEGCPFHPRCNEVKPLCREIIPSTEPVSSKRSAACHLLTFAGSQAGQGGSS